jgi:DNA repair protein RadC
MPSLKIQELPTDERPREKLAAHGQAALSEAELIAILLRTGMKGKSAIDIGRELVQKGGSLAGLARCSVAELARVKGVGMAKAVQLAAAFGLATRLARERNERQQINTPEIVYDLLGAEMRLLNKESLRVVLLDTKYYLIQVVEVSLGSLNESIAHPREVFQPVMMHSAYAFILVHNHPSGDPTPSEADRRVTVRLNEAAKLMQINFFDHIILGTEREGRPPYFSFREAGMI